MFSIFAATFKTAIRHDQYQDPISKPGRSRPLTTWEIARIDAERRRAAMRNVGIW